MRSLPAILSFSALRRVLIASLATVALAGCSLLPEEKDMTTGWSAGRLYSEAKDAQADGNWDQATKLLEKLDESRRG